MARKARIDAPGALHHIIIRGIERKPIFRDNQDKDSFVKRLADILSESSTFCYAWALMTNHVHLLLRSGLVPVATVMRRLLTGYAQHFNRRYRRHGPLFQNRYKSILCEEDPYLKELVRYIHLNPVRAGLTKDLEELGQYPYSGHWVLIGKGRYGWQDKDYVLGYFGKTARKAQKAYESFMVDGVTQGRRPELVGGGLVRSYGGWSAVKALRSGRARVKGDERILGSSEFVEAVLLQANEQMEEESRLRREGITLEEVLSKVANYFGVEVEGIRAGSKEREIVHARSAFCNLAVKRLGRNGVSIARELRISPSAISKAVKRGQGILKNRKIEEAIFES